MATERVEINRDAEIAWLHDHYAELQERHAGEWIALDGQRLVGHGPTAEALMTMVAESGSADPFVTAIPHVAAPVLFVGTAT